MEMFADVADSKSGFIELAQMHFRRVQYLFPITAVQFALSPLQACSKTKPSGVYVHIQTHALSALAFLPVFPQSVSF